MNRPIKFRAWTTNKQTRYAPNRMWSWEEILDERISDLWKFEKMIWSGDEKIILMQFTGLVDKNGKEIYEGDIVLRGQDHGNSPEVAASWKPWAVGGDNSFAHDVFDLERFLERGDNYSVIGNVYENPNLLKP